MSSRNRWKRIVAATALLAVVALAGPARADPIVSLIPSATTVYVGDTFWLDVAIGLNDPGASDDVADLYGFQISLMFDPGILRASAQMPGAYLPPGDPVSNPTSFIPGVDDGVGHLEWVAASLTCQVPGVSGSGVLASIMFTALVPGATSLALFDGMLLDSSGNDILPVTWSGVQVTVESQDSTPVPEPASLLLVAMGAVLAFARRGRRRP